MNKHEVRGGVRYVAGKAEKAFGDAVESRDWQATGVVDQVAGGAENLFGRAQNAVRDMADATPGLIADARGKAEEATARTAQAARRGATATREALDGNEALLWAAAAAIGGYALGWLVHGRRG